MMKWYAITSMYVLYRGQITIFWPSNTHEIFHIFDLFFELWTISMARFSLIDCYRTYENNTILV